jgi:hypothetical protein
VAEERRDRGQGRPEGNRPHDAGRNGGNHPGDGGRDRRRFGKHRGNAPRDDQGGEAKVPEDQGPRPEPPTCPLCGKPVYDLSTALSADREKPAPAHFDCVVERVAAAESLGPNEKLVYLGSGAFGVVEFKDKSESSFAVKRRVQWEKEGEKQDWRKSLSSRISNL